MIHLDAVLGEKTEKMDYGDQVRWLLQISEWLRMPKDLDNLRIPRERIFSVRIKYLLQLLERNPEWKINFTHTVSSLLLRMSTLTLFTQVGLSQNASFLQDFLERIQEKILPQSPLIDDLSTLMTEVFPTEEESLLVDGIDEEVLQHFLLLFDRDEALKQSLRSDLWSASYILSSQLLSGSLQVQGLTHDFRTNPLRLPESVLQQQIFQSQNDVAGTAVAEILKVLDHCEEERQNAFSAIKKHGIKVDSVYLLETQRRRIERLRRILHLLQDQGPTRAPRIRLFIAQLILDIHHQRRLRPFFAENLGLLTQRIVEGNSHVGEHYVTFDWRQFNHMFRSALGGGGLTAFTVFVKMMLASLGFVGLVKGLLDGVNYALSFLGIQAMGWTLATKQPSATAPYLAHTLRRPDVESRRAVVALLRTQFIAVLGNLTLVFPICFVVSWLTIYFGHPLLDTEHALTVFHSSNILGPSSLYAVFTGFLLFLSSLIAGWWENWANLHRVPERILHNQTILRFLGRQKTAQWSSFVKENTNGLAGNISLGFLLGISPQIVKFMSLPLDVRHITLATGGFAASLPAVFDSGLVAWDYINAASGLLIIGALNISVSFTLALFLAAAASRVRFMALWRLLKFGISLVLSRPWLLVIPEKAKVPMSEEQVLKK